MKTIFIVVGFLGYCFAALSHGAEVTLEGFLIVGLISYGLWFLLDKFFPPDDMDFPET